MSWDFARQYCKQHDYDLASIHSGQEEQQAADQCTKLTQRGLAAGSKDCAHHLAHGDVNGASGKFTSNMEDWVFVGCFVSDKDGGSHGDPWPDTHSNWKNLDWLNCRNQARKFGYNSFVMEYPGGYKTPGHASCGHMETIAHGNYHDGGHNGQGRAPDSDCASEIDKDGHLLGGPWRFALYAPKSTRDCLLATIGDQILGNVHNVDECVGKDYKPSVKSKGGDLWMMVGCFVSNQDGVSHSDKWKNGKRWVAANWYQCRDQAVKEGSPTFVMEYGQGCK